MSITKKQCEKLIDKLADKKLLEQAEKDEAYRQRLLDKSTF